MGHKVFKKSISMFNFVQFCSILRWVCSVEKSRIFSLFLIALYIKMLAFSCFYINCLLALVVRILKIFFILQDKNKSVLLELRKEEFKTMTQKTIEKRIKKALDNHPTLKNEPEKIRSYFADIIKLTFQGLELDVDKYEHTSSENLKFAIDVNIFDDFDMIYKEAKEE